MKKTIVSEPQLFARRDLVRMKSTGVEFKIEALNENPNYREDGELYGYGWGSTETIDIFDPSDIELVRRAKPLLPAWLFPQR
ncbi:hypothetical protein [Humidisolicoccus flavus]|uniref:hypothetical protein n=1 Tax=Humidisolicoccus flavus TaxID=3111414 RepID=UPI003252803A